jgi:hypothetical protein
MKLLLLSVMSLVFGASLKVVTCNDDVTLQTLMTTVQQQAATIQALQAQVTSQESTLTAIVSTNHVQDTRIADVQSTLTAFKTRVDIRGKKRVKHITQGSGARHFANVITTYAD